MIRMGRPDAFGTPTKGNILTGSGEQARRKCKKEEGKNPPLLGSQI